MDKHQQNKSEAEILLSASLFLILRKKMDVVDILRKVVDIIQNVVDKIKNPPI